jgi:hypothetical protein
VGAIGARHSSHRLSSASLGSGEICQAWALGTLLSPAWQRVVGCESLGGARQERWARHIVSQKHTEAATGHVLVPGHTSRCALFCEMLQVRDTKQLLPLLVTARCGYILLF